MSNLQNVSAEELKRELQRRIAKDEMDALITNMENYINDLGKAENIQELVTLANTLVYRFNKANRVLNPSTGKRGRKAKTS